MIYKVGTFSFFSLKCISKLVLFQFISQIWLVKFPVNKIIHKQIDGYKRKVCIRWKTKGRLNR